MNLQAAIICALVYLVIVCVDTAMGDQTLTRPIIVATLTGLFLGDLRTGIIMGAQLEAIFMGISAIGGAVASDANSGSIIAVAYTILVGGEGAMETGMALAMSIGTVMVSFNSMFTPIWASMAGYWEKLAGEANPKKFAIQNFLFLPIGHCPNAIALFLGIGFGIEGLGNFLASCPPWVLTGLSAAGAMMTAVGFGILLSMIWDAKICAFYFVGFVMAKSLGLSSLGIAIIGVCCALTYFFVQKDIVDATKTASSGAVSTGANSEEDFF